MRPCPPIQDALRRGNPPLSLHRTPPRPSGDPRKHAGTLSRRPPYSNFAPEVQSCDQSAFSLTPGAARSLLGQDRKGPPPRPARWGEEEQGSGRSFRRRRKRS